MISITKNYMHRKSIAESPTDGVCPWSDGLSKPAPLGSESSPPFRRGGYLIQSRQNGHQVFEHTLYTPKKSHHPKTSVTVPSVGMSSAIRKLRLPVRPFSKRLPRQDHRNGWFCDGFGHCISERISQISSFPCYPFVMANSKERARGLPRGRLILLSRICLLVLCGRSGNRSNKLWEWHFLYTKLPGRGDKFVTHRSGELLIEVNRLN